MASGGTRAGEGDAAEAPPGASALRAAPEAGLPLGAVLVCAGSNEASAEAPAEMLRDFDRVLDALQEILRAEGEATVR